MQIYLFVTDLGNPNVRKTGDLITLDYEEEEYQSQGFATRTENVNPFNIVNWIGSVELEPESDIWVATNQLEVNNLTLEGSYQAFMDLYPPEVLMDGVLFNGTLGKKIFQEELKLQLILVLLLKHLEYKENLIGKKQE